MQPIEKTTVLNFEDKTLVVKDLPEKVQNLIELFDDFRSDEQTTRNDLIKCQLAVQKLQQDIAIEVQNHLAPKEEADPEVEESK
jgi:hypothetical protein